jgi:hypothetical protein
MKGSIINNSKFKITAGNREQGTGNRKGIE